MHTDVNVLLEDFRIASRDLKNNYFISREGSKFIILDGFSDVEGCLFENMVLLPLGVIDRKYAYDAINEINVILSNASSLMVNRYPEMTYGYWDGHIDDLEKYTIKFVRFFDFDQSGYIDNSYVMVKLFKTINKDNWYYALQRHEYVKFGFEPGK